MKARELEEGHVLVDPDGHLYEVVGVIRNLPDKVHVWLWLDSSSAPIHFQTFEPDDEIVAVGQAKTDKLREAVAAGTARQAAVLATEVTTVIPIIGEDEDAPDAGGVAE